MNKTLFLSCCLFGIFGFGVAGCVADGPTRRANHVGKQPRGAQATVLLLNLGPATDSDGDGVVDTVMASVHLFDEMAYPLSLNMPGTITFQAFQSGHTKADPIQTWTYADPELAKHAYRVEVGTVYRFRLMIPTDAEAVTAKALTFHCTFTPDHGNAVQAWHRDLRWASPARSSSHDLHGDRVLAGQY